MSTWERLHLNGWEASAASVLVLIIDTRLRSWVFHHDGPGMWRWETEDDDGQRWIVAVNAREDRLLVPCHGWPAKVGPTVLAARFGDPFATVTLPSMSDRSDAGFALLVLSAVVSDLAERDPRGVAAPPEADQTKDQKLIEEEERRG